MNAPAATKFGLIKNGFVTYLIDSLKTKIPLILSSTRTPTPMNGSPGIANRPSTSFITERSMSSLISLVEQLGGMSISISDVKSFLSLIRASVYVEKNSDKDEDNDAAFLFPRLLNR